MLCRCFQQWSVEHYHVRRPGSGRSLSIDSQDRRIEQEMVTSRTASREEIRAHVAPVVSPTTIGTRLFATGLRSVVPMARLPLRPTHDTAKQGYSCVVKETTREWNVALLSLVMRVGSACMRLMDVLLYGVDMVSIIFWSAFAHVTQTPPQASWCGEPSVTTRCHIWCSCRIK